MTDRQDVRKDLALIAPDIRALQYSPEGQVLLRFLKMKQELVCLDLETTSMEELHKLQGRLCAVREIISAISG